MFLLNPFAFSVTQLCFFYVVTLISGSSAFSKPRLYIWKFSVHVLLKPSLKDLSYSIVSLCFPDGASDKAPACQCRRHKRQGLDPQAGRSPEKDMTAHSSILAWRIPWTEEPGRLQSMGLQRVRTKLTQFSTQFHCFNNPLGSISSSLSTFPPWYFRQIFSSSA